MSFKQKRTVGDVWQLECQAGNVTASVQSDHLLGQYMLPVFFDTISTLRDTTKCLRVCMCVSVKPCCVCEYDVFDVFLS